ncbi:MAG TPA: feruloyl-CoA synthase, partial [Burkholderiales bacterium]|nr:feruloyl-CoA synthase [Burkholderiales bacterium]
NASSKDLSTEFIRARLGAVLERLAHEPGSSTRVTRLLVLSEPPSIDANEITDKGYLNQRAVLERRKALVETLYASAEKIVISS